MVVYGIKQIFLLFLLLLHTCHASITITYPTATIVPGSTMLITWINSTTTDISSSTSFDIELIRYNAVNSASTSVSNTTVIASLGLNIKASKLSYSVKIPSNLYSNLKYSIIFMRGQTQIASSWPLTIFYVPVSTTEDNDTLNEINISSKTETNIPTVAKAPTLSVTSSTSLITASSSSHLLHSPDIAGNDLGPTLTSDQVAYIAMSIVGILGTISVFYFFLKWIYERRKTSSTRQSTWDDSLSTSAADSIYYFKKDKSPQNYQAGSSGTNSSAGRTFTVLENINEEENTQYYDSQYYSRFYTTTESLTIPPKPVPRQQQQTLQSRPTSPFGEMPTTFNGNRYEQLPLPPPPNTYSQHQ